MRAQRMKGEDTLHKLNSQMRDRLKLLGIGVGDNDNEGNSVILLSKLLLCEEFCL